MSRKAARHRFFAESIAAEVVALSSEESRHALDVLRLKAGEPVIVFDGTGGVGEGVLEVLGRGSAAVKIHRRRKARPLEPAVELAFAAPKGRRLDWLLEKATELGATTLSPVIFERSVVRPKADRQRRWRSICVAAAKQSGAEFLPGIAPPRELPAYLASAGDGLRVFGDPSARTALPALLERPEVARGVRFLVGPEGGMTDSERAAAIRAGFLPVRLAVQILRVETAAVGFLMVIRAHTCVPLYES